ncbi:hypothetical protein [Peterkaempfera griseoplana]|uniref:hypothetical protein n=1 Tax=Peterkaempfera griseoplana TaxID=66896 RepID=UPI0006E127F0|nr:hypothetical protein [Peterkaempfera griseoplana]
MNENEIKLKAIAALTAVRSGVEAGYVSDLLSEVIPTQFTVPVTRDPALIGLSVLEQLSDPLGALVSGFIHAFDVVADAYDETGPTAPTEAILQQLALDLSRDDS